jgi:enediyne biosynthesis protein E4
MPSHARLSAALSTAILITHATTSAQTTIDGIQFQDRAAQGSIVLGNWRGSLGVIDVDGDGWMDLVVADNKGLGHQLFRNVADQFFPNKRTFANVTTGSGLDDADGKERNGGGVAVADYDNDGDADIYIAGLGFNPTLNSGLLYRNDTPQTPGAAPVFTNVSLAAGVRLTGNLPEAVSFNDVDHDGLVDLFVVNIAGSARKLTLLRNAGNGTFVDESNLRTPILTITGHDYGHVWTDFDADGWADVFLIPNSGTPSLLRNVPASGGGRQLVDVAAAAGYTSLGPAPMGIAAGDMDNDGDLDIAITDAATGTYYENLGQGKMKKITPFSTFFGWGISWLDADNDGWLDNYQAGSWSGANPDRLIRNLGNGQWKDVSAALNTTALSSQHSIQMDFNNDGRPDIITINPGTPGQFISIYENTSPSTNHWLTVQLDGGGFTNAMGIGATVRVVAGGKSQIREVTAGSSLTASEDPRAHFGLGTSTMANEIRVTWPASGGVNWRTSVYPGPFNSDQIVTLQAKCPTDVSDDGTLNINDFIAFQTFFAIGDDRVDCDGDQSLTINDFICFQTSYALGC